MQDPDLVPPIRQQKQALRQTLRAQRAVLAPPGDSAAARAASEAVAAAVARAVAFPKGGWVAVYAAVCGELDPSPMAALAAQAGSRICYPRIQKEAGLAFHLVTRLQELRPERHGIPAPAMDLPLAPAVDVFVVPGLGFDGQGRRLGSGRGYYDAALSAQPAALRIGVGYDWQLLPAVPTELHDELLDLVVTPAACIVTRARPAHPACQLPHHKEETT